MKIKYYIGVRFRRIDLSGLLALPIVGEVYAGYPNTSYTPIAPTNMEDEFGLRPTDYGAVIEEITSNGVHRKVYVVIDPYATMTIGDIVAVNATGSEVVISQLPDDWEEDPYYRDGVLGKVRKTITIDDFTH